MPPCRIFIFKRKACLPLTRPQDTHGSCLSWNKSSSMSALRQDEPFSWLLHGGGGWRALGVSAPGCWTAPALLPPSSGSCWGGSRQGPTHETKPPPRGEWAERKRRRAELAARGEGAGRALLIRGIYRFSVAGGVLLGCLEGTRAHEMGVEVPMSILWLTTPL